MKMKMRYNDESDSYWGPWSSGNFNHSRNSIVTFWRKKLPELSRSIGKSLGEFKKGQREGNLPEKDNDDSTNSESS